MSSLVLFKWVAVAATLLISLGTGLASLRFVYKYQRLLEVGDAAASGIFIGAAVFHLYPNSVNSFIQLQFSWPHLISAGLIIGFVCLLTLIDRMLEWISPRDSIVAGAWLLTITISIHALVTGLALGLSDSLAVFSVIFVAILAHKGFEMFAFVVNLHRRLPHYRQVLTIAILFSLVTPIGIIIGSASDFYVSHHTDLLLTAYFNTFACGTFLYIGAFHKHKHFVHESKDSQQQYSKLIATLLGIIAMGVLGIWI